MKVLRISLIYLIGKVGSFNDDWSIDNSLLLHKDCFSLVRGAANNSLAQPTSWCRRTESILSFERGVCTCAELQVFACYGILLIDYLPKGQSINTEYYSSLLVQLMDIVKEKRRGAGRSPRGILFLHDNAPAHRALATQKELAYLGFQCLDHPPYSPDLAPSDYHLFPGLKKNNWKVVIFRLTRRSLPPRRPGWTDNFLNFL